MHIISLGCGVFLKNWCNQSRALRNGINEVSVFSSCYRLTSVKFNIEELQAMLLNDCEFRENGLVGVIIHLKE